MHTQLMEKGQNKFFFLHRVMSKIITPPYLVICDLVTVLNLHLLLSFTYLMINKSLYCYSIYLDWYVELHCSTVIKERGGEDSYDLTCCDVAGHAFLTGRKEPDQGLGMLG